MCPGRVRPSAGVSSLISYRRLKRRAYERRRIAERAMLFRQQVAWHVDGFVSLLYSRQHEDDMRRMRWEVLFPPARVTRGDPRVTLDLRGSYVHARAVQLDEDEPVGRVFLASRVPASEHAARLARTTTAFVWDAVHGRWNRRSTPEIEIDRRPTVVSGQDQTRARFRVDWDPMIALGAYAAASQQLATDFDDLANPVAARHSRELRDVFDTLTWSAEATTPLHRGGLWNSAAAIHARRKYRHLAALREIVLRQRHRNRALAAAVAGILRRLLAEVLPDLLPRGSPVTAHVRPITTLTPAACQPVASPQETRAGPGDDDDADVAAEPLLARCPREAVAVRPGYTPPSSSRRSPSGVAA